ncbi:MAG: hypothetical protein IRZ11_00080 [Clostridia bacterium]|nr:hypothetical protein [Clostridia bacterium]
MHVGSVLAGDRELAYVLAKECFARREEYVSLWVVARRHVRKTSPEDAQMIPHTTDRRYRLGEGYRISVERWRALQARRRAEAAARDGAEP